MNKEENPVLSRHPCFSRAAGRWFVHLHLPVATGCNIRCRYCTRVYDCVNGNGPGTVSKPFALREALKKVDNLLRRDNRIIVVGVAGPGEPLAKKVALDTLGKVHQRFPELIKCVSTNGLMLEESLDPLQAAGVKTVTVTVNAVDPKVGRKIYSWVFYGDKSHSGIAGAGLLIDRQLAGIREAKKRGIMIKVNSILIPGVNDRHLKQVALAVKEAGAYMMNVMPLFPQADFALLPPPDDRMLELYKRELSTVIRQADPCRQCHPDVMGKF